LLLLLLIIIMLLLLPAFVVAVAVLPTSSHRCWCSRAHQMFSPFSKVCQVVCDVAQQCRVALQRRCRFLFS
jgi:hypothetical protein